MGAGKRGLRLQNDLPVAVADDPLGFGDAAAALARLILDSREATPFTLGIEGAWGAGKSSLMACLRQCLEAEDGVETVFFNAWTAGEGEALEGLIKSVLDRLDPNILRRAMRSHRLMSWGRVLTSVAGKWLGLGGLVDDFWQRMKADPQARNQMQDLICEAMAEWSAQNRRLGQRLLIVFVDDLDRCAAANVFQIFEAIKLYLEASGFVFVVGYDPDVVNDAILAQYRDAFGGAYLEKIVQFAYRVPPPDEQQGKALLDAYLDASGLAALLPAEDRTLIMERGARNPRRIKRFLNRFVIEYTLDDEYREEDVGTLIKTLILQLYYRPFWRLLEPPYEIADPFKEFLSYVKARYKLRQGTIDGLDRGFFAGYGLPPPHEDGEAASVLEKLEQELPEVFPALAADSRFVSLVEGLVDRERRDLVVEKVRLSAAAKETDKPLLQVSGGLRGLRVLWIDDNPLNNQWETRFIQSRGGFVQAVIDTGQAITALWAQTADVVISDIGRPGRPKAGFEDLLRLRSEAHYEGPVIFYTGLITPWRRAKAARLGAHAIVNEPQELFRTLKELPRTAQASGNRPV